MTSLEELLTGYVERRTVPGAVALVVRGTTTEVATVGLVDTAGTAPMERDTLFRIASITKPITAAAVMMLVDDGAVRLDDPVERWLPELGERTVVRTPESPVDDVVRANRPITVEDLLSSRAGYGFPSDFSLPQVQALFSVQMGPLPQTYPDIDIWLGRLSAIPLLHQPGEAWLYNTCSDLQGVLVARASGSSFADFLAERVFTPLEMTDTSFQVPSGKVGRLSSYYRLEDDGLTLVDHPLGQWSQPIAFCSGAGGLVSTVDDWLAFARMLLADGQVGGRALLSRNAVRRMITDHLTPSQRLVSGLFLEGQGWGYGGSVDIEQVEPWNVAGRYGWVGGTGTTAHLVPATGMVSVLLTQVEMSGPTPPAIMRDFWDNVARG